MVAVGVQGVDLGRTGEISLIQLTIPLESKTVFLLDVQGKSGPEDELLVWIKNLFESLSVVKVMHDCRMAADALYHLHGITLTNVHDIACWFQQTRGPKDASISVICEGYGLTPDPGPSGNHYFANHRLWAVRPLTRELIQWGAKDGANLLAIFARQLADATETQASLAKKQTQSDMDFVRDAEMDTIRVQKNLVGAFIGRNGNGMRSIMASTGTRIYPRGPRHSFVFHVYFRERSNFEDVKRRSQGR